MAIFADIVASKPSNLTAASVLTARTQTNATNLSKHKKYPATNQPQGMNVKKLNNYFVFGVK